MQGQKPYWDILKEKSVLIVLSLFSVMIVSLCFIDTINYDEFFSVQWCRLGWKELMQCLIDDVHPPLYYLLLKPIFNLTGESMFCTRLLSAIAGIIMLWAGGLFIDRHFGKKASFFFVFFLYLNPFMIQKTTEIRMYMLASVFTIMSGIMSYLVLKDSGRKNWLFFTVFSLLAAYTHYYALLTMVFLYAGLLIYFVFTHNSKNIITWFFYSVVTVLGYLPWLPIAWRQVTAVNRVYWISMPSSRLAPLRELFYSAVPYTEYIYPGIILFLMLTSIVLFVRKRTIDGYWALMCCSALWGIIIFSVWYASHVRPILVSRYLIMPVCLCVLGSSSIVRHLNRYIAIAACLFCTLIGGPRYQSAFLEQFDRITTKTVVFINKNQTQSDTIIYVNDGYGYIANCVEYYFPNMEHMGIEESLIFDLDNIIADTNGSIWFFDNNQYMLQSHTDTIDYTVTDFGTFGFGATEFEIYQIQKVP